MKTVEDFAASLTDDVKSEPKKIEEAFKTFCLTAKGKQERLVSQRFHSLFSSNLNDSLNEYSYLIYTVLLFGRIIWIGGQQFGCIGVANQLVDAST